MTVRSHTADSVRRSLGWLRFVDSDKAKLLYPAGRRSVETWMSDVASKNPEVRAFQRLRTVDIELVVAIRQRPGKSKFDVFYLDMAGRHVPGLNAKDWDKASVEGVVAVRAIDTLRDEGYIEDAQRAVWLGEHAIATHDAPSDDAPFRNRLVAGTALMAALTTHGGYEARRQVTRSALVEHGLPNHPDRAAAVAAAQAAVVFQVDGTAEVGQVTSTLMSLFKHPSLWKDDLHSGEHWWVDLIADDPDELHDQAVDELGQRFESRDKNAGSLGPHQRDRRPRRRGTRHEPRAHRRQQLDDADRSRRPRRRLHNGPHRCVLQDGRRARTGSARRRDHQRRHIGGAGRPARSDHGG